MNEKMKSKKNEGIQSLRGIACIIVVLSHYIGAFPLTENHIISIWSKTPIRVLWNGSVAVDIFFVLSGFFYINSNINNYWKEVKKRFIRLYPAYFGAICFGIIGRVTNWRGNILKGTEWVNSQWQNRMSIAEIIKGFIFFPTFDATTINGALWTMKIELMFIFLLPIIAMLCSKMNGLIFAFISILIASFFCNATYFNFLMYLPMYAIGMVVRKNMDIMASNVNKKENGRLYTFGILLAYVWIALASFFIQNSYIMHLCVAIGTAVMIPCIMGLDINKNLFSIIGDYSYYIYLIHFVIMLWFRFIWDEYSYYLYLLTCLATTMFITIAFFKIDSYLHLFIFKKE
ncbi:acyltransferase family protein [Butyrivibrio hungatei]|jgi:peptidoglycan/LPS O-acetylase OafA/YrhL|uniref:Acyltransferase n=1 Tax=Butyrivibrio hungatei TaxID=185008 RepID=A0A1D9NYU5_9FIRM|nr:acyltransferase [Butyrivibrio hungatei]AOZ95473.1 acyltransferase [Butyrivibrio hungatei]